MATRAAKTAIQESQLDHALQIADFTDEEILHLKNKKVKKMREELAAMRSGFTIIPFISYNLIIS